MGMTDMTPRGVRTGVARRRGERAVTVLVLVYAAYTVIAEMMAVAVGPIPGAFAHALLVAALVHSYALLSDFPQRRAFLVLALLPLMRLLSLTVSVVSIPQVYWYPMIGVPLLLAAVLIARQLDLASAVRVARAAREAAGEHLPDRRWQWAIALTGVPLGLIAHLITRAAPLATSLPGVLLATVFLVIFSGITEEYIFRGLLQPIMQGIFGQAAGLTFTSLLFAGFYLGTGQPLYVLLMALAGGFFGWVSDLTGSLRGVMVAHSLMVVGVLLVWPLLLH